MRCERPFRPSNLASAMGSPYNLRVLLITLGTILSAKKHFSVYRFFLLCLALILPAATLAAQNSSTQNGQKSPAAAAGTTTTEPSKAPDQSSDPLKRPLTEQQKKTNAKALKQELSGTYKKWL